jgi:hypothetical protein
VIDLTRVWKTHPWWWLQFEEPFETVNKDYDRCELGLKVG